MAVRFIIGRAGSGKTNHCLEAIRTRLADNPADGPRLILLVPEQASLQMERVILLPPRNGRADHTCAAHRAEVLSFERLADRVFNAVRTVPQCTLTEPARAMVIRHLLSRHHTDLKYYGRLARGGARGRLAGLADSLGAAVAELLEEGVEPDVLQQFSRQITGDAFDADPVQRAKFHDLGVIYQAYLEYLGPERMDPSQRLAVARDLLPRCGWLSGAELWVDGFASLSDQESRTLIVLAAMCCHTDITVLMDPAMAEGKLPAGSTGLATAQLFHRTARTFEDLCRRAAQAGLQPEEPIILGPKPTPRFSGNRTLDALERSFFQAAAETPSEGPPEPDRIELVAVPTRRIEVEYAVSRICQWVRESGGQYRYRDVAIITRDLEPYHDLLTAALTARNVPYFIDRRRLIAHHPLPELLRAACTLAGERMSLPSVRLALKTGLLPIAEEDADELENYLLANGIEGPDLWGNEWTFPLRPGLRDPEEAPDPFQGRALARINTARSTMLQLLDEWLAFAGSGEAHTGREWPAAIIKWFNRLNVGRTLRSWAQDAEGEGRLDEAEEHRQVWREAMSLLDDAAFALGDVRLTIHELAEVLDAGLAGLTLGLVPPTVDQVLVGSIERSRHPDIKAAVIIGFNDGHFPQRMQEDSILNDDDRDALARGGAPVRPAARERTLDEAMLVYVALTRASDALSITYSLADEDGQSLRPSPLVSALTSACPGLQIQHLSDPSGAHAMWDVLTLPDLSGRLACEFRERPPLASDPQPQHRALFNALYERWRGELRRNPGCRRALVSLDESAGEVQRLSPEIVKRLYQTPLRTSVTELETFAACPFRHFSRHVLKLRERAEAALEPVDMGTVCHAILEDFIGHLPPDAGGFVRLSEEEVLHGLRESCGRVAALFPDGGAWSKARDAYLLQRSMESLARLIRAQQAAAKAGETRPRAAELPFGFNRDGSLPALELTTPRGRRVLLRGYIDRVDLAELGDEMLGVVIDYKHTREKRLDLSEVFHGLTLQLPAYLLVLAAHGTTLAGRPIRPIGALYVSLASQYEYVDHPDDVKEQDAPRAGTFSPRGLIRFEDFDALDAESRTGPSAHYRVYRKKDGTLGREDTGDAIRADAFHALLDQTQHKLGELADAILDGEVAVRPYRLGTFSPCTWCSFQSVCRFEMGISEVRYLQKLKRPDLLARLHQERSTTE